MAKKLLGLGTTVYPKLTSPFLGLRKKEPHIITDMRTLLDEEPEDVYGKYMIKTDNGVADIWYPIILFSTRKDLK